MKRSILYFFINVVLFSCTLKNKEINVYHKFERHTWNRYEHLLFNIPVEDISRPYNIYFYATHSQEYEFDNLDFGMIMNTPSGEERINQYKFMIKKKFGGFLGDCGQDSCVVTIALKEGITFTQPGILRIEVENLVPRLEVTGLFGAGIKFVPDN